MALLNGSPLREDNDLSFKGPSIWVDLWIYSQDKRDLQKRGAHLEKGR
jgi:hypothetical protein